MHLGSMLSIYLFAAAVGGGLLAFSLFGGHDGHHDFDHGSAGDHINPFEFLSIRTLTYFLFVFGGVGGILTWAWGGADTLLVLAISTISGVGIGALVSAVFRYLRRTDSGATETEDSFVGLPARVTLPIATGGLGKITVQRGGRAIELLARPHEPSGDPAAWRSVVVVEMQRGTALVAPVDPALQESQGGQ